MSAIPVSSTDARVRRLYEVAQEYRAKNYRVIVGPSQHELPDFLRGFEPDLVVTKDDDHAVVEVKSRQELVGKDATVRMAHAVEQRPEWRFELVLVPGTDAPEEPLPEGTISVSQIRTLLAQARELRAFGIAIAPAVAAAEHAMLIAAARAGLELPSRSPAAALKTLFAHGLVSRQAYDDLGRALTVRNQIVHGAGTDIDAGPWLDKIESVVEELIGAP